jgi:hypothetical protein
VHARDDRSLVETVMTLPQIFAQARRIARSRPLDVGPCSLRRRLSPRTGRPDVRPLPGERGAYDVDPRQHEGIAAAWLACVLAAAATEGVASICTFEAAGDRGLVTTTRSAVMQPANACTRRSPAHAVLAAFARRPHVNVVTQGPDTHYGAAFALVEPGEAELWLVDLSGQRRQLPTSAWQQPYVQRIYRSTGGARWSPMRPGSTLPPYGIARVSLDMPLRATAAIADGWRRA